MCGLPLRRADAPVFEHALTALLLVRASSEVATATSLCSSWRSDSRPSARGA